MKLKATKKQIKNNYSNIICLGYCSAQHLLYFVNPFAYSAGVYGWACDYYRVGNTCISTGYGPIGNIRPAYDLIRDYNNKAIEVISNTAFTYELKENIVNELLNDFINKC